MPVPRLHEAFCKPEAFVDELFTESVRKSRHLTNSIYIIAGDMQGVEQISTTHFGDQPR